MLKRLIHYIESTWYRPNSRVSLILKPLSLFYQFLLPYWIRHQKKKQINFKVPLIVVGNITVGGTGKTPTIIFLAKQLIKAGFQPAIVSRGYQASLSSQFPILVQGHHSAEDVGDEPFMIYKRTRVPVMICSNRPKAVSALLEMSDKIDIVLSDDGLQHYSMGRDIEIAVIDGDKRMGNGLLLPAGPLREPISRLKTVDFIISQNHALKGEYQFNLEGKILFSVNNPGISKDISEFRNLPVHAVAGIGNPHRFFKKLNANGLKVIPHIFSDHYFFKQQDLEFNTNDPIIMTEKDAVKCQSFDLKDAWYLPVEAQFEPEFIIQFMKRLNHG